VKQALNQFQQEQNVELGPRFGEGGDESSADIEMVSLR
jgi:hypothetical protein